MLFYYSFLNLFHIYNNLNNILIIFFIQYLLQTYKIITFFFTLFYTLCKNEIF